MNTSSGMILTPLSTLYRSLMWARRALYRKGIFRVHYLRSPVISIGNITTGGTGKTPLVEWVARVVASHGRRVCVLSRGYGRADPGERVLVSDGKHILATVREAGDEPLLLAEMLLGVACVISDADRVGAARWAEANLGCDAFILDDGFQHQRLARDLDVVTIDASNPWGRGPTRDGMLLPRGRLREPQRELRRADCLIITRAEQSPDVSLLLEDLRTLARKECPILICETRTTGLHPLGSPAPQSAATLGGSDQEADIRYPFSSTSAIGAICALGNPEAFFAHLRRDGYELRFTRAFADHHVYSQADIDAFVSEAKRMGAEAVFTTAKDSVKLQSLDFGLPCAVLEMGLEIPEGETLIAIIQEALEKSAGRSDAAINRFPR